MSLRWTRDNVQCLTILKPKWTYLKNFMFPSLKAFLTEKSLTAFEVVLSRVVADFFDFRSLRFWQIGISDVGHSGGYYT